MSSRLVVVSNRLPVVFEQEDGRWVSRPGSGGLITALTPVLRRRGGLWVGWTGACCEEDSRALHGLLAEAGERAGFDFAPVTMTAEERDGFYHGFSNEIVWPLFHDLDMRCNFEPEYWEAYRRVNRRFAHVIKEHLRDDDFIWIHDYHLMHVARELRELGVRQKIGFFLHIPFPPPEIFLKLPWRFDVLEALLDFDGLGFQTQGYRRNFAQCVNSVMPGISIRGRGRVITTRTPRRRVQIGVFPISIDFDEFARRAAEPEIVTRMGQIQEQFPNRKLILGVDRLDYTKGIPERLRAFGRALERFPELREHVTLMQVVVPSRTAIGEYQELKAEIEMLVSDVNGRFTVPGWVPVHYLYRSFDRDELIAMYRAADVMAVTSLRDGMNLVAKEYCACRVLNDGVLILSEFAGTAATMHRGAILVNPHDREGMAQAIHNALMMSEQEQKMRMRGLRRGVRVYDVYWWLETFLRASHEADPDLPAPPAESDLLAILPPGAARRAADAAEVLAADALATSPPPVTPPAP